MKTTETQPKSANPSDNRVAAELIQQGIDYFRGRDYRNPPEPEGAAGKRLLDALNGKQREALQKAHLFETIIRRVGDFVKDEHGCIQAPLFISQGSPSRQLAVEAYTGQRFQKLIIDPRGNIGIYNGGEFNSNARMTAALRSARSNTVWDFESMIPKTPAEMEQMKRHLKSKEASYNQNAKIANECGKGYRLGIVDPDLKVWAEQNLKLGHNGKIVDTPLGGAFGKLKDNTVSQTSVAHHVGPAKSVSDAGAKAVAVLMTHAEHAETVSYQNDRESRDYRKWAKEQIKQGSLDKVIKHDLDDVREINPNRYDPGAHQASQYYKRNRAILKPLIEQRVKAELTDDRQYVFNKDSIDLVKAEPEFNAAMLAALTLRKPMLQDGLSEMKHKDFIIKDCPSCTEIIKGNDPATQSRIEVDWKNNVMACTGPSLEKLMPYFETLRDGIQQGKMPENTPDYQVFEQVDKTPDYVISAVDSSVRLLEAEKSGISRNRYLRVGDLTLKRDEKTGEINIYRGERSIVQVSENGIEISGLTEQDSSSLAATVDYQSQLAVLETQDPVMAVQLEVG